MSAAIRAAVALVGEPHRDEIADTFEAAVTDADAAAAVVAGRLTKGLTPTAVFAPLGDAPLPDVAPRKEQAKVDEAAVRTARERAVAADQAVVAARHALTEAEAAAKAAWAEVDQISAGRD